jgi:hypothetical protein
MGGGAGWSDGTGAGTGAVHNCVGAVQAGAGAASGTNVGADAGVRIHTGVQRGGLGCVGSRRSARLMQPPAPCGKAGAGIGACCGARTGGNHICCVCDDPAYGSGAAATALRVTILNAAASMPVTLQHAIAQRVARTPNAAATAST